MGRVAKIRRICGPVYEIHKTCLPANRCSGMHECLTRLNLIAERKTSAS